MSVQIQVQSNSRQAQADLRNLERSLRAVEQSTVQINQSLARTGNLVKFAFAALPLGAIATKAISTAASFEKLSARLDIVTGSATATSKALAGVQKLVKETPFNVQVLTDGYARLAATGNRLFKSQANIERGLQAIANATAAVGGSNVEFRNVATAFERASSEGRITAERLNQLVDAGIPLTKVADRLGLSMEELRKETEKGNFTFDRFYQAFVDVAEAADGFGGAASRQVNTLNGAFSNLNDAFDLLFDRTIRQSGVSRILVRSIVDITKVVNDFSEGLDLSILIGINNFRFFIFQVKDFAKTISNEFDKLASSAISFLPEFNFDISDLQNQLADAFGQINIRSTITAYTMQLSDFLPGLETVKSAIKSFGAFIKHVFWDIYDQVVGNSFWPDMIDGVVDYASGLLGKVKPYFDRFRDYVNGIFLEMKNSFDELFKDIQIKINVSSETGSIKTIANFIDRITTAFDNLVKAAKEQPIIVKTVDAVTEAIDSIRQAGESIDPAVWSAMSGAFNAINIFAKDGLPRLLSAIGLTKDVKEVKSSSGGLGEATRNIADQLTSGSKDLANNINKSSDGLENTLKTGIAFSEQLQKVYNSIGETIGRIIARVFFDEVFKKEDDFADFFALAIAAALSRPLRNLLAVTAVLTLVLGPDNNVSTILAKVFDSISQFGNKVLQGAGVTGFLADTSLGGFLAGLLFGGLSLALVTGRLGPILLAITKIIGEYVFFRKVLGNSDVAIPDANKAGRTLGQKFGSAFNTAARTAGFGVGLALGASLADDVIAGFKIEDQLTKVMITAGLVGGTAYAGSWIASALVVFTGAKLTALWTAITVAAAKFFGTKALAAILLAALIPSSSAIVAGITGLIATIAGVLTLPVILTALGVAAGSGLLYYVFFGAGDDTFAGKFRKAIEENVFNPLKSSFEDLMSFVGKGIEKLTSGFISFRKAAPITSGDSGDVSGFATGGRIKGRGTGTSDSILAKVSNGEYIINAAATKNNLPLLERINSGLPAFKTGGLVGEVFSKYNDPLSINLPVSNSEKGQIDSHLEQLISSKSNPSGFLKLFGLDRPDVSKDQSSIWGSFFKPGSLTRGMNPLLALGSLGSFNSAGDLATWLRVGLHELGHSIRYDKLFMENYKKTGSSEEAEKYAREQMGAKSAFKDSAQWALQLKDEFLANQYSIEKAPFEGLDYVRSYADGRTFAAQGSYFTDAMNDLLFQGHDKNFISQAIQAFAPFKLGQYNKDTVNSFTEIFSQLTGERSTDLDAFRFSAKDKKLAMLSGNKGLLQNTLSNFGINTPQGLATSIAAAQKEAGPDLTQLVEKVNENNLFKNEYKTLLSNYQKYGNKRSKDLSKDVWATSFFKGVEEKYKNKGAINAYLNTATAKDFISAQYYKAGAGNKNPEDGWNFRGRGWFQYTGRAVYEALGLLNNPNLLGTSITENIKAVPNYFNYKGLSPSAVNKYSASNIAELATLINNKVNPGKQSDVNKILPFARKNLEELKVKGFATGGRISGPGSGTSDSILARLSNGEYVINAEATKQNLPLLEQINNGGLPKFNQGGPTSEIDQRLRAAGFNFSSEKLAGLDPKAIIQVERALRELEKRTRDLTKASADNKEITQELVYNFEDTSLALLDKLAPAIDTVAQSAEQLKANFNALGAEQASGFKEVFKTNLQKLFKGQDIEGGFLEALTKDFTGRVVDSFTSSLVDSFFKTSGAEGGLGSLFSGIFGLGDTTGKAGGGAVSGVMGLFGKDSKPDGSSPSKALFTQSADGAISGLLDPLADSFNFSGISGVTSGSEQDKMLADQFGDDLSFFTNDFVSKTSSVFGETGFLGGLGDIFSKGVEGFSGAFKSISGLIGGGAGGGVDWGGLLKIGMSFIGLANGGYVSGQGTSTSDSIPAMLSNGEYVINAKATAMAKPLLEAINQGKLPRFATGGIVTDTGMTSANVSSIATKDMPSKSSSEQVFNISITGDISNQTKSEIYKMLPQIANGVNSYNKEKNIRR